PSPSLGQFLNITETDQRLFDAIGWNRVNPPLPKPGQDMNSDDDPVSVPEPGSAIALLSVVAIAAGLNRRRQSRL
ncbi:MAG: PEP-CTERM sorting domain-containing protein, partial [Synechococcales bacterium]|nr:PEP-CTERM sorting domain-containing protein [Synechococcales bacterium]